MERVEKYRRQTRILHWVHVGAFVALLITGIFLYFPPWGGLAEDNWTRMVHRLGAVVFVLAPIVYMVMNWKTSWESISEGLTWGWDDWGWVSAAPRYYFLGDEAAMPPQEHMNTGQKLWYLILLLFGPVFVITGILMWFFKDILPSGVFMWSAFAHDVAFIVVICMFFVHVYLSVLHPLMRKEGGAFGSMINGTVTVKYAKSHHGKWYDRITKGKAAQAESTTKS